jgi:hypothetical protein
MKEVGKFHGHLAYFTAIWYIFPVLVCCAEKNLATLVRGQMKRMGTLLFQIEPFGIIKRLKFEGWSET